MGRVGVIIGDQLRRVKGVLVAFWETGLGGGGDLWDFAVVHFEEDCTRIEQIRSVCVRWEKALD